MKQLKIIQAYKEMEKLADNQNISDETQWEIFKLRKIMKPHVEFQQEREEAIKSKYIKQADESGKIYGDVLQKYAKELNDLNDMDVEIDSFVKPSVPHTGLNFLTMEKLEDFMDFT